MEPARESPTQDLSTGFPLRDEALDELPPTVMAVPPEPPPRPGPRRRPPLPWLLLAVVLLLVAGLGTAYALSHRHANGPGSAAAALPPPSPPAQPVASPATTPGRPPSAPTQPSASPPAAAPPAPTVTQVSVPSVVGHRLPDAVALLRQAGLVAGVVHVRSEQPTGRVIGENPAAGAKEAKGGRVRLEVSVQPLVTVPDVVGMHGLTANHALQADHLAAFLRYVPSSQPARTVIAQHPSAGTKVRRGTHVEINISKGGRPSSTSTADTGSAATSVPDVVGEDQSTATSDLEAAGFSVDVVRQPTADSGEDGIVLDQSPAGGSKTTASTVTIDVGSYSGG